MDLFMINALEAIGITLIIVCPFIVHRITKYRIEIEKIRQDAEVRKEEIRCRNQLELEKFMMEEKRKEAAAEAALDPNTVDGAEKAHGELQASTFRDMTDARPVDVDTAAADDKSNGRVYRTGQ
ncbi:MAG TPA: hypothetical protein VIM13_00300 [Clostridia bacterium]